MQISFLIVTKNRPEDLALTLNKLKVLIDVSIHEVLVFIDGCSKTEVIIANFDWVKWIIVKDSISASPARCALYKKAKGTIFIGLDDDAHPLTPNLILQVEQAFTANTNLGIIAFQEVRGLFEADQVALKNSKTLESYFTNDFIGCGFAIKKDVYEATNGFPVWIDIYGEETAVALEVLDLGYDILYEPNIKVNHRIDGEKRKQQGRNYFRFGRQLKNTLRYYIVYYPNPTKKVIKTLWHNFKKYALKDWSYFKSFVVVVFSTPFKLPKILKYRQPVKSKTIKAILNLKPLKY
ncbi:glycosyltransferase family 2 protein [Lutibacter holmesii]|uniref:Glycosyltransferase family 2 protein n=1 Tax=Lutibacter holmesii TaxID=1137985 RepID=A0ABW3WSG4_9FLAO